MRQSELRYAEGPGPERTPLERIELPESFEDRIATLHTGDLLFVRNRTGHISHVVFWSEGNLIPCGIHLWLFRKNSWYNMSASHALRVFADR